jgi:hypothetical protein
MPKNECLRGDSEALHPGHQGTLKLRADVNNNSLRLTRHNHTIVARGTKILPCAFYFPGALRVLRQPRAERVCTSNNGPRISIADTETLHCWGQHNNHAALLAHHNLGDAFVLRVPSRFNIEIEKARLTSVNAC